MDAAVAGTSVSSPQPTQLIFEDGLGERRYAIGAVGEPLEILKLSAALSSVSSFDFALRERTARLAGFRHESYGRVRTIELDRRTSSLLVTSDYIAGIRVSTLLTEAQKRGLTLEFNAVRHLIRQLASAAAALHSAAPDVGNGAIAPQRLILTPAGRLIIVEYALGAALEQLALPRARYWRELAVAVPGSTALPVFDTRTDVTQVGVTALALILGRPLTADEYPERLADLIRSATTRSVAGSVEPLPQNVRDWLMQALQLDQWESFASPSDARAALDEAFGIENAIAESGALQAFMTRYAAPDVHSDTDLGPRLEAMKAFLARYPSRRATTTATPSKAEGAVEAPAGAAASVHEPATPPPVATSAPAVAAAPTELSLSDTVPIVVVEPEVQPVDPVIPAPSYVEERRSAAPVRVTNRLTLLAAGAGVLLLIGALAAFAYFRGGS